MSDCSDLLGLRYELGADGKDGAIDCIHLVYEAHRYLGISDPPFNHLWYEADFPRIARDLLQWGERIGHPAYDGDVVLLPQDRSFCVTWRSGILYINQFVKKVAWLPLDRLSECRCSPTSGNSSKFWAFRAKNTNSSPSK